MKAFDVLLLFSHDLDESEEIKEWKHTWVEIDDNDIVDIYDIETVDGEIFEVSIQVTKEV